MSETAAQILSVVGGVESILLGAMGAPIRAHRAKITGALSHSPHRAKWFHTRFG